MSNKRKQIYSWTIAALALTILGLVLGWTINEEDPHKESNPIAIADDEHDHHSHEHTHHGHDHDHAHEHDGILHLTREQIGQMGIKIQQAGPGDILLTLSTRGKIVLHPDRQAHVIPQVAGIARDIHKNIGQTTRAGEVMAILESSEMADIKASYLAALCQLRLAQANLAREERLYHKGIAAGQDYLQAQNACETASIHLQLVMHKLRATGLTAREIDQLTHATNPDLRAYSVCAPIDGIVVKRHLTKGELTDTTHPIYEIADLRSLWVEMNIYPQDLDRVHVGQTVEIIGPSDRRALARLIYISPLVSDENIAATAVAELNNEEGEWQPGTFAQVNILTEKISAPLVISLDAVQNIEGKETIFVSIPEGFVAREIELGRRGYDNIEVLKGLTSGERYAATHTFLLKAELGKDSAEHEH